MKALFLFFIRIYRRYLSGLKRTPCCRFYPTCSAYTYEAVSEWGAVVGLLLGILRILRCNPLVPGGVDHIPLRGSKRRSVEGYIIFYGISPYKEEKSVGKGKMEPRHVVGAVNGYRKRPVVKRSPKIRDI